MLYHASKEKGLETLEPRVSTHGKAYVYAIRSRVAAVCFGAPKDDFDLLMDEEDGIVHLYECYPHAVEKIYGGKSCRLYEVGEEGFLSGMTGWDAELVCEAAVPVLREEYIRDIRSFLLQAQAQGKCVLHRYSQDGQYRSMLREELGERIRAFGLRDEDIQNDPRLRPIFGSQD